MPCCLESLESKFDVPEVRGIVPIVRPLHLEPVLRRTQKELGGFPFVVKDYVDKDLYLSKSSDSHSGTCIIRGSLSQTIVWPTG